MPINIDPDDFMRDISEMVRGGASYIDAVTEWCTRQKLEPEVGAEMVQKFPEVYARLQMEAECLNHFKKRE